MPDPLLPNDLCRCHDGGCPYRKDCLRWLHRKKATTKHGQAPHCSSLFPDYMSLGEPCPLRIAPEEADHA